MEKTKNISGAEAMVKMLEGYGIEFLFGLCGDTSLPFYDCLNELSPSFRHILTRDERSAAYMADGYARVTGKPGICEGPSGGGATYILPGLVEANESSIPILAITSDVATHSRGKYPLTELDQKSLFRPLTKYNEYIEDYLAVPKTIRAAFRQMTAGKPGSAHLCFPIDAQRNEGISPDDLWVEQDTQTYPSRRFAPDPAESQKAVELIQQAKNPAFLCGGGPVISGAFEEMALLAEKLGAIVYTSISGKGILSENHPLCAGVVGSNGGHTAIAELFFEHDLIIMVGCRGGSVTTEKWTKPLNHHHKIIHIDSDPAVLGSNYKVEAALLSDAKLALRQFCEKIDHDKHVRKTANQNKVKEAQEKKFKRFNALSKLEGDLIKPEMIVKCLQDLMPENAVIVADAGTPCPYFAAYYRFNLPGRRFISNRAHGALGYSMSAAIGVAFGKPEAKCVSIMGDGSFCFTVGELETAARYKLPVVFIVISNAVYGWIKAGQKTQFGKRYFSVDFNQTDNSAIAKGFGVNAIQVKDPSELPMTLEKALNAKTPFLVDIVCQPLEDSEAPVSEWIA